MNLTKDILLDNGFIEEDEVKGLQPNFRKWTQEDRYPYKLDVTLDSDFNNTMKSHHIHIDNSSCSTVGALEFDTVEQFNLLMEALGSGFRLKA